MTQINRSFKISILLATTLLLANCGKKEFSAATQASETAKGGEVTPVGPGNPGDEVLPPNPDVPVIPPGGETPLANDVLIAILPVSYYFLNGAVGVSELRGYTSSVDFMMLARDAVAQQAISGCEPTYDVYRVRRARAGSLQANNLKPWVDGIKKNSAFVGHHQADWTCNQLETGQDFE